MFHAFLLSLFFMVAGAVTPRITNPPRQFLRRNAEISIKRYFPESDAFEVSLTSTPDVGPNYATPEDLLETLELPGTVAEFRKKARRDLSAVYTLRRDLLLLWAVELKIRAKHRPK